MINFRVHVGPETILPALHGLPKALRPLVGEGETDDRLDVLEAIFPWHGKPERCAELLGHGLAVSASDHKGQFVRGLLDRQPLNIRPWVP